MPKGHVLIVGAGLGGLCLAKGLQRSGVAVSVYERDVAALARAQGYRIHLDTRGEEALRACLPPQLFELFLAGRGQPSTGATRFAAVDGRLKPMGTMRFSGTAGNGVSAGTAVDRAILRQILLAGLGDCVQFGKDFLRYEQDGGGVTVEFADGTAASGDVLVAADGVGSRIRGQFLPQAEVMDLGVRWLGGKTLLTDDVRTLLPPELDETFGFVIGLPHPVLLGLVRFRPELGEQAVETVPGLLLEGAEDYAFWGVLAESRQLEVVEGGLDGMDGAALQTLVLGLAVDWPESLRLLIERCQPAQTFVLTIRRAAPVEHWQAARVTLLGDAIHVMPPNGSGANTALRDAALLCQELTRAFRGEKPLLEAIDDYEREMLRYGFESISTAPSPLLTLGAGPLGGMSG